MSLKGRAAFQAHVIGLVEQRLTGLVGQRLTGLVEQRLTNLRLQVVLLAIAGLWPNRWFYGTVAVWAFLPFVRRIKGFISEVNKEFREELRKDESAAKSS